ncbi:MAG: dihydroorotate dehydrogenase electron transfer subunit [Planctomycetaceae bacterium]|nr:dihydroorotate dehydrogenase electron transfer subunit [Planctomycetaceae bacterium]
MATAHYADQAWHGAVTVAENVAVARDTYRVRFACPEIARRVTPGQFVMLRLAQCNDPLLGRPLAVYDVTPDEAGRPYFVDVVYLVVGKMTRLLTEFFAGSRLEVWGPLGNGFPPTPAEHLVMVAGGIGQTPFLSLAREYLGQRTYGDPPRQVPRAHRVTLCYGAKNAEYLAGVEDFRKAGVTIQLSTDDGSLGHHGLVTELIEPVVERSAWPCRIVCCGPEPMLQATAAVAERLGLPCLVSLESPMACGLGVCFSCVKKIRDREGNWDYRRTCVEGPVFRAEDVEF